MTDMNEEINMTDFKYYFVIFHEVNGLQWMADVTFNNEQRYDYTFVTEKDTSIFLIYEPLLTGKMKSNLLLHRIPSISDIQCVDCVDQGNEICTLNPIMSHNDNLVAFVCRNQLNYDLF